MELIKKVQSLKKGRPAFIHRLVEHCRRLCAVIICISMVLSGFPSVFLQAMAAGGSKNYVYEFDGISIYDALDKAIAEGTTLDSALGFSGEHLAEYDELFTPDGTLYELKDLKTDSDPLRDKDIGLRVFARIEGDINLDDAYEVNGTEEIIFLFIDRDDTEHYVQLIFDDHKAEPVRIPAAKDIPAAINNDNMVVVPISAGSGSGTVMEGDIAPEVSADAAREASADEDSDTETEYEVTGYEDTETEIFDEYSGIEPDDGYSEVNTDDEYSEIKPDDEYSEIKPDDEYSEINTDDEHSETDKEDEGTGINQDYEGTEEDSDEKNDHCDGNENDHEISGSADADVKEETNIEDKNLEKGSSDTECIEAEKESSDDKNTDANNGTSGERASVSLKKTGLLTASIMADPEEGMVMDHYNEAASPSDATPSDTSWHINGTVYDAVLLGSKGAAAYVTTMEELGLDRISSAYTTLTYEGEDYRISVSYGRDAGLPRGVELSVSEYERDSDIYQTRLAEAAQLNEWNEDLLSASDNIRLFDISLIKDGMVTEPESEVKVEISYMDSDRESGDGAQKEAGDETGYTIIHFGDTATEFIEPSSEYEDDIRRITFSLSELSDVMVIEGDDYGISMLAVSADNFDFITSNVSGEGTVNGNTFHYISQGIDPVENSSRLKMNMSNATVSGSLLSTEDYYRNGTTHIKVLLLDVKSLAGGSSSGKIGDTKFDENVQGKGSTLKNIGTITFTNAGTIHGRSVNVVVSIDSVRLYNSFAKEFGTNGYTGSDQGYVGLKNNKISIGYLTSSVLWLGENYCTDAKAANERYTSSYYTYPCSMDEAVSIEVRYADTGKVVDDASFLHVAEDIDIYYRGEPDSQSAGRHGIFAETFKTVKGFSGDYYIYPTDRDYIHSDSKGVVTAQATQETEDFEGESGTTGENQYKVAGIYADTVGGSWEAAYSEGWCSTIVEIYDYTTNDITIRKADRTQQDKTLNDAGFYLYYELNEEESGKETLNRYYYSGYDATYHTANWVKAGKEGTEFTVPSEAMILTTEGDGTAKAYCLSPGDYFLEEISAPDGYNRLTVAIRFSITTYGIITSSDPDVVLDEGGSLTITILNTPGVILPDTGGGGTQPFRTAGMFVSGSALYLLYIILSRKRRWSKRW